MPINRGIKAEIIDAASNIPLLEFPCDIPPDRNAQYVVSVYVEAVPGAKFKIKVSVNPDAPDVSATFVYKMTIDGKNLDYWRAGHYSSGVWVAKNTLMPFCFRQVRLTEDRHGVQLEKEDVAAIGVIELSVYRALVLELKKPTSWVTRDPGAQNMPDIVYEKDAKGKDVTTMVGFGDPTETIAGTSWKISSFVDQPEGPPYVLFRFYYMKRSSLQLRGLMAQDDPDVYCHFKPEVAQKSEVKLGSKRKSAADVVVNRGSKKLKAREKTHDEKLNLDEIPVIDLTE